MTMTATRLDENILLTADNCRYCLMCRHVCPIGHVTGLETLTPHGWGLMIASNRRGLLTWNDESVFKLYSCADCGTCRAHCVTDQPLPETIATARAQVVEAGLAPPAVGRVAEMLQRWQNPYEEQAPEPVEGRGEVALFVGDEATYLRPGLLDAALKLLEAAGIRPVLIGRGRSNGYVASSLGLIEIAHDLARANLEDLAASGARRLLVLSPGDFFAFKQLYPERLQLSLPDSVDLSEVTVLLAQALDRGELAFEPLPPGPPHAYVDPSHSVRVKTRYDAPRKLLAAVIPAPPVELFWRRERTHPVGSTALKFTIPQFADHLTWARLGDARQAGAQRLISEDAGTLKALGDHAARFGVEVLSLYELLASQLR
ncbi:MAG: (Fe-S)-binding protein [Caldilineae bacterium]|nr:MAG: (Fe-S)-binding protein [Caldilineae bacterium]